MIGTAPQPNDLMVVSGVCCTRGEWGGKIGLHFSTFIEVVMGSRP